MGESLNDAQVMHAMALDDMYHVQRVLAWGAGELTELVTIEDAGPFVRKKIPGEMARRCSPLVAPVCKIRFSP